MFEEANYNFLTSADAHPFQKKLKGCKNSSNNFAENSKRIAKPKQVHLVFKAKPNQISKENIKQHNLDKVRKQLKFEHQKQKEEQLMCDETAEDEAEMKKPEDEAIEQCLPSNTQEPSPYSSQINEKYAEQMLNRFKQNEVFFFFILFFF